MEIKRIGILVGGGPAPGTNGVIAAVAIEAINRGCAPVGFHDGFEWLAERYTDEQHELTIDEVSRIHLDGGVMLGTSRADIAHDRQSLENAVAALKKLGIDALVTIGGDDLVRSSMAIEQESHGSIKVVQVPKSIDNDLWLPQSVTTLGFETARQVGVELVHNLMEDARTTGRWYFGVTMGRPTGHLTLGIGKAASATCTIIPEEFHTETISLADIVDIVEGSIIKRRAMGRSHGVALLAEALVERFDPAEVAELQDVDRDAQGNIRVTEIDLGRKVKNGVQIRLEQRNIKVTIVDKTIGYELRCAPPVPYDAEYARDLGYAAVNYLFKGGSAALVTIQSGEFKPVAFSDVIDTATGRGRQRPVDVTSEGYQVARDYMVRLGPADFRDESWVEKLAKAAGLTKDDFLARFGHLAH
ncbi:MAG TPA: diphosphate--fructose-6-phosphate 1-phosphotransferase [Blastocatellia bacterium]|nr:diphosphate--fructose-6-phosphate 1-phosphotransferase [Blastocatellia bacterium]